MGLIETVGLVLGAGGVSSILTAWITTRSTSESKFRENLLSRLEQLERHDAAKSQRILDLERENRELRSKVADLESKLAQ